MHEFSRHDSSRRQLLRSFAAGIAAAAIPAPLTALRSLSRAARDDCAVDAGFTQPLFVPRSKGPFGRLAVNTGPVTLTAAVDGGRLAFLADSGGSRFANPTLVVTTGDTVRMTLANTLTEPTIAHWHGLLVDTRNDGNGETLIAPGERFDYAFKIRNRAGLYWYHPHPHGLTAAQTYQGLYGLIEIEDDDEHALRRALDLRIGSTELTLILQDRRTGSPGIYAPASTDELFGWYGDAPHVNGVVRPYHDVAARRYRLRVLNASNARTYRLAFRRDDGTATPFELIGTDGGLLANAVPCEQAFLAPAERIDVLVDFSGVAKGGFVLLESRAFDPMHAVPATQQVARDGDSEKRAHGHAPTAGATSSNTLADGAPFALMQFRIRESGAGGPRVPTVLSRVPDIATPTDDARPLRLGFAKGRWRINDRVYDTQATPIEMARGARETWLLRNYHTSAPHAMHLHGFAFRVLERETSPEQLATLVVDDKGRVATDLGWKDTVLVWPGESVRIAIDFSHPFTDDQLYLLHCHNLEHEDGGMMLRVRVG
jgi:suppressor of ftsI/bilirubin oxidase